MTGIDGKYRDEKRDIIGVLFGWRSLYAVFRRDTIVIIALAFLRDQPAVVELINRFNGEYYIIFVGF